MDMKPVYSSHVEAIGYDEEAHELHVGWQSGRTTVYEGVDPEKARRVMNAASVGSALHAEVKGQHNFR